MPTKTSRKPLDEIRRYLLAGMTLADCAKFCGFPVSALSIMCLAWNIPLKRGKPKGYKRVGQ